MRVLRDVWFAGLCDAAIGLEPTDRASTPWTSTGRDVRCSRAMLDLEALAPLRTPRRDGRKRKKPPTVDRAKLAALLHDTIAAQGSQAERELRHFSDDDRRLRADAIAFARSFSADVPSADLDPQVQAELAHLLGLTGFQARTPLASSLFSLWCAEGLAFALRVLVHAAFGYDGQSTPWTRVPPEEWVFQSAWPHWEAMRERLVGASDEEHRATYAEAKTAWAPAPTLVRCGLAYLFPEEPTWAAEAARAWLAESQAHMPAVGYAALASLQDREVARALIDHAAQGPGLWGIGDYAADAAALLGDDALPGLLACFAWVEQPKDQWKYARASLVKVAKVLGAYDDPRVTEVLVERFDDKTFGPAANDHLERFPKRALAVLAPSIGQTSKKATRRIALLDALVRTHADVAREVADALEPTIGRALSRRVGAEESATESADEAPREAWPKVLATPPWRSKAPRPVMPTVAGLVVPAREERVVLDDATRAKWLERDYYTVDLRREHQEDQLAHAKKHAHRTTKASYLDGMVPFLNVLGMDEDVVLTMWAMTPFASMFDFATVKRVLARFSAPSKERPDGALPSGLIDGALARLEVEPSVLPAFVVVDSPRVSVHLARAFKRPSLRADAQRALTRFPETHAHALVPLAITEEKGLEKTQAKDVELARIALRWMVSAGHRDVVLAAAEEHGAAAHDAIAAMLAIDPIELCPGKPPRLSDFADPSALPRVRLRSGATLPEEATRNLLEMLMFSPVDPPYAGIAQVIEACDRASLDRFAIALLQSWERSGGATASQWALHALGHVGSDAVVKQLAADIRRWPREKAKARALVALEVLARMGTDVALLHLDELSRKAKNRDVEAKAAALLAEVAEARGLGPTELEDRLVPTLELDAEGTRTIAIGLRMLTVRFDEHLVPYLIDEAGKRSDKITKGKGDEGDALARAKAEWKELQADVAQVGAALIARLERAMCEGRRWDVATFHMLFVAHPLARHLGRRLVWGVYDEGADVPTSTFRIAEDGTLADLEDAVTTLADDARVGIVHPLFLTDDLRVAWAQRLSDYEVLQPFEQLGRRVERVAPGTQNDAPFQKAEEREVGLGALLGALEARGWRTAMPDGDGLIDSLSRRFGDREVSIGFSPGFRPREPRPDRVSVRVYAGKRLRDVPPLIFAEVTRDLAVLGLA